MVKLAGKIIDFIENAATSFWLWFVSFASIIAIRLFVENWLENFRSRSGLFLFYEFTHTFLFFIIAYLLILGLLNKLLKVDFKKAANVLLYGYLVIITPPIVDYIISGGKGFWSFYIFDSFSGIIRRFFTFFGDRPDVGITYGVRIEVAAAVIFLFIYGYIKSKSILKSLYLSLIFYIVLFILGTFPSWITIMTGGFTKGFFKITGVDVAQMFLTPAKIFSREIPDIVSSLNIKMSLIYSLLLTFLSVAGCWLSSREKLTAFLRNARFPQLIYHGGLLVIGMGLGLIFTDTFVGINFFNFTSFLVLLLSVSFAWLASVVFNDFEDREIDGITNSSRPLPAGKIPDQQYKNIGWVLFGASILFSAIINFKIALLLIVYQAIAWLYSAWPLRLKRFALVSTFVSAMASLIILFSGFILISPDQSAKSLPFSIVALLVAGYTFSLPIKDFKDIEGDKKNGVYTVPVLFGEYWGKVAIGGGLFLSFILSTIVFNESRLFWWALLFGAVSFWIIHSSGRNKKISYKRLPWWILGTISIYGLILISIIF
jgi:4-hydroxybenzoate polyprenyltransferase